LVEKIFLEDSIFLKELNYTTIENLESKLFELQQAGKLPVLALKCPKYIFKTKKKN
jgi:hypothetical protein